MFQCLQQILILLYSGYDQEIKVAMQNKNLKIQFSERLRELMIRRGYSSHVSSTGVSPSALCKAINCFTEMALRYLDGRSIPSLENILKISEWLEVEPGFLLFGDQVIKNEIPSGNVIKIDADFLEYALSKITSIMVKTENSSEFSSYFVSVLADLSHLQIPNEQLKKVFDLTLKSCSLMMNEAQAGITDKQNSIKQSLGS